MIFGSGDEELIRAFFISAPFCERQTVDLSVVVRLRQRDKRPVSRLSLQMRVKYDFINPQSIL